MSERVREWMCYDELLLALMRWRSGMREWSEGGHRGVQGTVGEVMLRC